MRLVGTRLAGAACALSMALASSAAFAQEPASAYPSRNILVVIPYPPGGPPDVIVRMLGPARHRDARQAAGDREPAGRIDDDRRLRRRPRHARRLHPARLRHRPDGCAEHPRQSRLRSGQGPQARRHHHELRVHRGDRSEAADQERPRTRRLLEVEAGCDQGRSLRRRHAPASLPAVRDQLDQRQHAAGALPRHCARRAGRRRGPHPVDRIRAEHHREPDSRRSGTYARRIGRQAARQLCPMYRRSRSRASP